MKNPVTTQDPTPLAEFSAFEKATIQQASSNDLKDDIQRFLNKHLSQQKEQIEDKLSSIEQRCSQDVKETLNSQLGPKLEENFNRLVAGENDKLTPIPQHAEHYAKSIPGAKIDIFKGNISHFVFQNEVKSDKVKCVNAFEYEVDPSVNVKAIHEKTAHLAIDFFNTYLKGAK